MVTLYTVPGAWGLPSISPFCVKLETWLRMAGVAYQVKGGGPNKAPKGKIPFVEHDGKMLGDSQLILEHLTEVYGVKMDAALSPEARARAHVTRRMLEEGSYWALVHARWIAEPGWAHYKPVFLTILPPVIGSLIVHLIRRDVRGTLGAQGTGRHTAAEIEALGVADVNALATLLGEQPYFLGAEPTSVDATVYAFVASILGFPGEGAIRTAAAGHANLVAYRARMEARFWPSQS